MFSDNIIVSAGSLYNAAAQNVAIKTSQVPDALPSPISHQLAARYASGDRSKLRKY